MITPKMTNIKWKMLVLFGLGNLCVMSGTIALMVLAPDWMRSADYMLLAFAALLISGLVVGYFAVKSFQRSVDSLHFGIIQLSKGDMKIRLPIDPADPFQRLFDDFNHMAQSIERQVHLLHKTGEENVRLQAHTDETAVIEERKRLARDLHDTVSQHLFAIHMSSSSLPKLLERSPDNAAKIIEQLTQMSHHAQRQIRGLIAQLRPVELEGVTLTEGLNKWFPDYCRQNGLQGRLELQLPEQLSDAVEHQLFLIVQEGMANVVKHASAESVLLSVYDAGHQVVLMMQDDGQGFARDDVNGQSYGLTTMRERAQKLGGDLDIVSKPGAGTALKVKIPKFKDEQ